MTERETFEAWVRSEDPTAPLHRRDMEGSERFGEYCAHWIDEQWTAWQASRRAAIKEAHSACLAGVKWSPEPSKQIQFYVNGTCHRLAAEISKLAEGGAHD